MSKQILVVGAGAIGQLFAAKLALAGHRLSLLTRTPLETDHGVLHTDAKHDPWYWHAFVKESAHRFDAVLVTTKAFQAGTAVSPLRGLLAPTTPLIVMCNGMGAHLAVTQQLPEQPLLLASTRNGARRTAVMEVQHMGNGLTLIGATTTKHQPLAQQWQKIFQQAIPPCQISHDIYGDLWHKLVINAAINPFTAIHDCRNGQLLADEYQPWLQALCAELAQVMTAEGYPISASAIQQSVRDVAQATANNSSSMREDLRHQRPSEIDQITGYIVACAKRHHIAVPLNTQLLNTISK